MFDRRRATDPVDYPVFSVGSIWLAPENHSFKYTNRLVYQSALGIHSGDDAVDRCEKEVAGHGAGDA
jgi:hypothetical protein